MLKHALVFLCKYAADFFFASVLEKLLDCWRVLRFIEVCYTEEKSKLKKKKILNFLDGSLNRPESRESPSGQAKSNPNKSWDIRQVGSVDLVLRFSALMQAFEWEACNQKELYVRGLSGRTRLTRAIYVLDELPYSYRSWTFVSSYVGSSDPTTQLICVPALRK